MELPEEMIQHIQSFLNAKEAAQTSILSKSWNKAWVTRSNLDFSSLDFKRQSDFVKVTKRTLERYEKSKLKIHKFRLMLKECSSPFMPSDMISLGIELIKKAIKLDATDLDIENLPRMCQYFVLPSEVFQSESLVRLSFVGGEINAHEALKVSCSRLKSLNLCRVYIQDNIISDIVSMCPLIEDLKLSYCRCSYSSRSLVFKSGSGVNDLHKLKVLWLDNVKIGEWLFRALSTKSPYLNDLRLNYCSGFEEIQICSDSLESITILCSKGQRITRVKFDIPRIQKFMFTGSSCVPSLCFKTSSREWESLISFPLNVDSSRFLVKFRKFLLELSSSKIYLELSTNIPRGEEEEEEEENMVDGLLKPPMVETLALTSKHSLFSTEPNTLKNMFLSCRPKVITQCLCMKPYNLASLICYRTIKDERENRYTSPLHDLEKVDVEISGHTALTWSRGCPAPTNTKDASTIKYYWWQKDTKICLQWR